MTTSTVTRTHDGHPIRLVTDALTTRPGSVAELARTSGLSTDEAQTALAVLESIGRARRVPLLAVACPTAGCSGCPIRSGCAATSGAGAALHTWQLVSRAPVADPGGATRHD